jgi:hypothetical protein
MWTTVPGGKGARSQWPFSITSQPGRGVCIEAVIPALEWNNVAERPALPFLQIEVSDFNL